MAPGLRKKRWGERYLGDASPSPLAEVAAFALLCLYNPQVLPHPTKFVNESNLLFSQQLSKELGKDW